MAPGSSVLVIVAPRPSTACCGGLVEAVSTGAAASLPRAFRPCPIQPSENPKKRDSGRQSGASPPSGEDGGARSQREAREGRERKASIAGCLIQVPEGLSPALHFQERQGTSTPAIGGRIQPLDARAQLLGRHLTIDHPVDQDLDRGPRSESWVGIVGLLGLGCKLGGRFGSEPEPCSVKPRLDDGGLQSQTTSHLASAPALGILEDEQVGIAGRQPRHACWTRLLRSSWSNQPRGDGAGSCSPVACWCA